MSSHRATPQPPSGEEKLLRDPKKKSPGQSALLKRHGLSLNKALGQHFLVDQSVPARICDAVAEMNPATVLELGPGAGALTFPLLDRGWPVRALEIDKGMRALLREEAGGLPLEVLETDLAKADLLQFLPDSSPTVIAGNLPYQITSPILFGLLPLLRRDDVPGAVVMVQAEVGTRMAAGPGSRDYGILSVLLQAELEVKRLFVVKPGAFLPPPKVDSAVLKLTRRVDALPLGEIGTRLVKQLFAERRKQIGGLLRRRLELDDHGRDAVLEAGQARATQRAEELSITQFRAMATRWEELG